MFSRETLYNNTCMHVLWNGRSRGRPLPRAPAAESVRSRGLPLPRAAAPESVCSRGRSLPRAAAPEGGRSREHARRERKHKQAKASKSSNNAVRSRALPPRGRMLPRASAPERAAPEGGRSRERAPRERKHISKNANSIFDQHFLIKNKESRTSARTAEAARPISLIFCFRAGAA